MKRTSEGLKLIGASAGDMVSGGFSISLGFGAHPCELTTTTLRMDRGIGTAEVAAALRDLAGNVAALKPEGWDLRAVRPALLKLARDKQEAWDRLLKTIASPARPGDNETGGRSVAPSPQRENPMANKKTAKKRAKAEAKKAVAKKAK